MNRRIIPAVLGALLLAAGAYSPVAQADASIPIADFFKKAEFSGAPVLSPDGQNMAVLTPRNGRFVLAVINLDTRASTVVASDPEWDVANPIWVNNRRLVFSINKGGEEVMEKQTGGGLFAVNSDGTSFRKLVISIKEATSANKPYKPVSVLTRVGGDSNDLIVVNNERGRDADLGASDVFRLDTTNGRMALLTFNNPGAVSGWVLDHDNVIRVASSMTVEDSSKRIIQTVYLRDDEKAPWKAIYKAYLDEGKDMNPLGFDFDNKTLFVAGRFNGRDKAGVHIWNTASNTAGELIAEHPEADIPAGLIFDESRKKVVGVSVQGMKPEMYYFDEDYARLQAMLDASLPGERVRFQWSGTHAVVFTSSTSNVGKLYHFDTAKKTLEPLYSVKPELEGKKLSEQTVIRYQARDGMSIPAYLTLPEGRRAKALPLVAYIHGGPHARDGYGFDPITQMLASRGFAVLQPQFRMSTGFGWKHHVAGWKQWGLAMQDDITDGIETLVKQGVVDRNRVCIIGASYGGYATMYGLVKNPDLYKCGINWVGVTDVKMLFTVNWSDMSGPVMDNIGAKMHGDPKTDDAYFAKVSAIGHADQIKAPVLMAYGSEDRRVPLIHGEKMRDVLLKQGNTVEWMVMTGEGHGWSKESNNIKWGETVYRFINRYIGDGATAAATTATTAGAGQP
ncbi:S9 family peptidase [Duganella phyllosphaerae]|uniref:Prolyl tripeptidyl peptidase n=1 Tax=Duganella phyllosphaerae TaxID=762836 RepID=A0A1E7X5X9_9BURK|nr:S9 family peptidase [Duganella phyllosphaerae]OFA08082.1 prolyl tripeptidyl peptidase precursor [Duganella phyllosphaerae]